jgi:hypothetical protein
MSIPQVARLEKRLSCGVGSSSGESADEGEDTPRRPPVIRESARCHLGYGSSEEGGRHPSGHGHGSVKHICRNNTMRNQKYHCIKGTCKMRNEIYQNETKRTCAAVSTTACNRMPCTYIGTRNTTPINQSILP